MKVLDLVILHSYIILENDLKHFYTISIHSFMILERLSITFYARLKFLFP